MNMNINNISGNGYTAKKVGTISPMWIFVCQKDTVIVGEYGAIVAAMSYTNDGMDFDVTIEDLSAIESIAKGTTPQQQKTGFWSSFWAGFSSAPTDTKLLGENPNRPVFKAKRDGAMLALTSKEIGDVFAVKVEPSTPLTARPGAAFAMLPGTYIKKLELPSSDNSLLRKVSGFNAMQQICGDGYALIQTRGDVSNANASTASNYRFSLAVNQYLIVNPDVLLLLENVNIVKPIVFSSDPNVSKALENDTAFLLQSSSMRGEVTIATTCQRHRGDAKKKEEEEAKIKKLEEKIEESTKATAKLKEKIEKVEEKVIVLIKKK